MRLLSRALFTLVLLAGLAFGSYAFGQHVLASKLFGNKGSKLNQNFGESPLAPPPSHSASRRGDGSAIASVEVLPESGDSGAPSKPEAASGDSAAASDSTIDHSNPGIEDGTARPGSRDVIGDPNAVIGRDRLNASDASNPDHPRRRRRRRKPRATPAPDSGATTEAPARQDYAASPDAVVSQETAPRDTSSDSAPRIEPRRETPSENSSNSNSGASADPTPRRHRRTRTRVEEPAPRTRVEPRRETSPTRRSEESPVPRPEGGDNGGGESPVPVPE